MDDASSVDCRVLSQMRLSRLARLQGGRNNDVYLMGVGERKLVLKQFTQAKQSKDRYLRESYFLRFANSIQNTAVPELIATCPNHGIVLTTFVQGSQPALFSKPDLEQTLVFLQRINSGSQSKAVRPSHNALESVLDSDDFINSVKWRLDSLPDALEKRPDSDAAVIAERIIHYTKSRRCAQDLLRLEALIGPTTMTSMGQKFISPSDLGCHNVLSYSGNLTFIDFEYSGIDSGINLLGDFLTQPDTRMNNQEAEDFARMFLSSMFQLYEVRLVSVLRLHSVRWMALMLRRYLSSDLESSFRLKATALQQYFNSVVEPALKEGNEHFGA